MFDWRKYYKLPLTYDGYNYAWCENGTMALMFNYGTKDSDARKVVSILNGKSEGKIKGLEVDGVDFNVGKVNLFCVRGWGFLTGTGACNLPAEEAEKIQNGFIDYIKNKLT